MPSEIQDGAGGVGAAQGEVGAFVRGYFAELEAIGIEAAVLHGWQGGFAGALTDVDHVISPAGFAKVADLVAGYCRTVGWRLCQVLRHETTAAFCVCSWGGDPGRVVALDACSDYRRRGRVLIAAEELLAGREPLPSGGCKLAAAVELKYRLLKAAIKRKEAVALGPELADYPAAARLDCERWLASRWGVTLADWRTESLAAAWKILDQRTLQEPRSLAGLADIKRVAGRIWHPTGLILIGSGRISDGDLHELEQAFGRLYFRHTTRVDSFTLSHLAALVASTLVSVTHLSPAWRGILDCELWLEIRPGEALAGLKERIARQLEDRCIRREHLAVS